MKFERILELVALGRLHEFYTSGAWLRLRREVLAADHNECQACKRKGRYSRATVVHHINHVKRRPDLALCMWFDDHGHRRRNLESLCHE